MALPLLLTLVLSTSVRTVRAQDQPHALGWLKGLIANSDAEVADVTVDPNDGAVYAVGYTKGSGLIAGTLGQVLGDRDAFVIKFNAAGTFLWGFTMGGSGESEASSIALDGSGNIYVAGYFKGTVDANGLSVSGTGLLISSGGEDIWSASYTTNGALRWAERAGGSSDDRAMDIAVDAGGCSVFGLIKGAVSVAGSTVNVAVPNKDNLLLAHYDLMGNGQWAVTGTSGEDELPWSVSTDGARIYVTYHANGTTVNWYGTNGPLMATYTAADQHEMHISAFSLSGTHQWTTSITESNTSNLVRTGLAAGNEGLYLTGITHSPSTFPGGVVVNTGTHDFQYLARLDPASGNSIWVRSGTTTGSNHTARGTAISIGSSGGIHMAGEFKDDITIDGRILSNSTGKISGFLATFLTDGRLEAIDQVTSSHDLGCATIATAPNGGFVLGGMFKNDIASGSSTIAGNSALDGWLLLGQIGMLRSPDASAWMDAEDICASDPPFDLTSLLYPDTTGSGQSLYSSMNVVGPGGAVGLVAGSYAIFNQFGGYVTVDLGIVVPTGGAISVLWRTAAGTGYLNVLGSLDGTTFTPIGTISTTSTFFIYSNVILSTPARYIKLAVTGNYVVHVDGIYYAFGSDPSGTWSGQGVSGTQFDPDGLSGPVPITHTVIDAPDTFSTTHAINVLPAPVAGTLTGGGTVCSWGSTQLVLFGSSGDTLAWNTSTDGVLWTPIAGTDTVMDLNSISTTLQVFAMVGRIGCSRVRSDTVTVQPLDDTAPTIVTCAPSDTLFVDDDCQASLPDLTGQVVATDDCPGSLFVQQSPAAGQSVSEGTTTVTLTVTDSTGNASSCSVAIVVRDTIAPTIANCPDDTTLYVPMTGCTAPFAAPLLAISDNCGFVQTTANFMAIDQINGIASLDTAIVVDQIPIPIGGLVIQLMPGVHTYVRNVHDGSGNAAHCVFDVTVLDTIGPWFAHCPPDTTVAAGVNCLAVASGLVPQAEDNCGIDSTWWSMGDTANLAIGSHQLAYTVRDSSGSTATCAFALDVIDSIPPHINNCPAQDIELTADANTCTAVFTYPVLTADPDCGPLTHQRYLLTDGSSTPVQTSANLNETLPVGTHLITEVWTDGMNADSCSYQVTVLDNTDPVITYCPGNINLTADPDDCTALAQWNLPQAVDACGSVTLTQVEGPALGSPVPIGSDTVYYEAVDGSGNTATCRFHLSVIDADPPDVECPLPAVVELYLGEDCELIYPDLRDTVTVSDCSPWTNVQDPAPGTVFHGDTTLLQVMTITDSWGNTFLNQDWVHIIDNTPPQFTCPGAQIVPMSTCTGVMPDLAALVTNAEDCSGTIIAAQSIPAGSAISTATTVTLELTDMFGNSSSCTVQVDLVDDQPPTIQCNGDTIIDLQIGSTGVWFHPTVVATDNCGTPTISPAPEDSIWCTIGTTLLSYTSNDAHGNSASCSFNVTVRVLDCAGIADGTALPGTACDDGDPNTGGDTWDAACNCAGLTIDCEGNAGGSALPGTACDDGDPNTGGDTWDASCNCAGLTIDCEGNAGGSALPGTACDDGDPNTTNDTFDANCNCVGTPLATDCEGVPGGSALPGTSCDDGDPCTVNDTWDGNCNCAGTLDLPDAAFAYAASIYCTASMDPSPWVAEQGGTFSVDTAGLAIDPATGAIDLDASTPGAYLITHTIGTTCTSTSSQTLTITMAANATWTSPGTICASNGPVDPDIWVTGDLGGAWSGPGIGSGSFDPSGLSGTITLTYTVGDADCTVAMDNSITVLPGPTANAGPDTTFCGLSGQLGASLEQAVGTWSGPAMISFSNVNDPHAIVTATAPGSYPLTWTVGDGQCYASDLMTVTIVDPGTNIWVNAGPDQQLAIVTNTTLHGDADPAADLHWELLLGSGVVTDPQQATTEVSGLGIGTNAFMLTASLGPCASTSDTVLIQVADLFIPEGFSPNGDEVNDRFEITGISAYPENELLVFDRWGRLVYQAGPYTNTWDGHGRAGPALPDDTYFYVLNLGDGTTYKGTVIIKR
ncbi:MAG: HYR domain-containing protein [Flavobacteriales bacterium]|nr:HYR domain-containing protein [Flavobacteriales bacterium]